MLHVKFKAVVNLALLERDVELAEAEFSIETQSASRVSANNPDIFRATGRNPSRCFECGRMVYEGPCDLGWSYDD